jgi:m7GpppX diphosphatase
MLETNTSCSDLTSNHLPLLINIRDKTLHALNLKYGICSSRIKSYFHYQPSFYHLHVHFVSIEFDAPASNVGCAVLLDDVINNLQLMSDYYQRATLTFTRKRGDRLFEAFCNAGRLHI